MAWKLRLQVPSARRALAAPHPYVRRHDSHLTWAAHSDYLVDLRNIRDPGALWYLLSSKDYSFTAGFGVVALVFAIIAVALHRRKDQIADQAVPAEFQDSLPENYVRRSFDDTSDVRLSQSLPTMKEIAYATARMG